MEIFFFLQHSTFLDVCTLLYVLRQPAKGIGKANFADLIPLSELKAPNFPEFSGQIFNGV
jgi:hypothetical protein